LTFNGNSIRKNDRVFQFNNIDLDKELDSDNIEWIWEKEDENEEYEDENSLIKDMKEIYKL